MGIGAAGKEKPHFVLVPHLAQGHMIPMVDLGLILARRGATVTLVTTTVNAERISAVIERARDAGLPIRFVEIPFPRNETGLLEGVESADMVPLNQQRQFYEGLWGLAGPLEEHLRRAVAGKDHVTPPTCMIADFVSGGWARGVSERLQIPRLSFYSVGCFTLLAMHNVDLYRIHERLAGCGGDEPFEVPGLPQRVVMKKGLASAGWFGFPGWENFNAAMKAAELAADGVVINGFEELEPECIEMYGKAMGGKKVWTLGPFSLIDRDVQGLAVRGNKAAIDVHELIEWLDSKELRSVVYVSFGSLCQFDMAQLVEIGLGLEASGKPFVWVIKKNELSPEVEGWLSGGFKERTAARGTVIRGWAPQALILSHPSVGVFISHCGWNSSLEGIAAGVAMITWPHFGDQFYNERLIVDVAGVGVEVGVNAPNYMGVRTGSGHVDVRRDEVERAVRRLMGGGEEAERIRKAVSELGKKAREAAEAGGSSVRNLTDLIEHFSTR